MPVPFALPLAVSSTTQHAQPSSTPSSRARLSLQATRKRKRPSRNGDLSSEGEDQLSSSEDEFLAATNPLSLTPAEIVERKLAGLGLTEHLPSKDIKDFPHRSFHVGGPTSRPKKNKAKSRASSVSVDSTGEEEGDNEEIARPPAVKRLSQGPRLRLRHFSVLTTILQRCLHEGDLERANRAWAMLIRMQISGKPVDLRSSGYWGIGAELLMRSLDRKKRRSSYSIDHEPESNSEREETEENEAHPGKRRWGSKEGLERAKEYYERLILQYPYKRQHDTSISALDFWPAMAGCEIYGIEFERKESLAKLQLEENEDDGAERSNSESEDDSQPEQDDNKDGGVSSNGKWQAIRLRRRAERRWIARDEVRQTALVASEKLAARLDELMSTPPYADSHNMLELRGNIALYIGDLSVSARSDEDEDNGRADDESATRDVDRRQVLRQRRRDHEKGLKRQKEEHQRARNLFGRLAKEKGDLDGITDFEQAREHEEHFFLKE